MVGGREGAEINLRVCSSSTASDVGCVGAVGAGEEEIQSEPTMSISIRVFYE